ncbi:MAG: PQQ-dependent sugar dehydrogenase [Planctomycetes bacterium]|nr:PQQ-dependent sugar dehydrogenase [Planctomycetota bacterium]
MPRLRIAAILTIVALTAAACMTPASRKDVDPDLPTVKLTEAFPALKFENPVFLTHDGANPRYLYVVEQAGRILRFENRKDAATTTTFLDIRGKVLTGVSGGDREEGLLGLAFHPNFAANGQFFVNYNAGDVKNRRSVLARYTVRKDGDVADPESAATLLDFGKPHGNHNGCTLLFGGDGMLYAGYGDGGGSGDPHNNGQDLSNLHGKIIRIDVNKPADDKLYGIPADNPFVGRKGARGEIFAYGLRNPYRMSMDGENLWVGDVGNFGWESIHLVKSGGNYGWSLFEGSHEYKKGTPVDPVTPPVVEYGHEMWRGCVIGGYVYRGERYPALRGIYLYADFVLGRLWGLEYANGRTVNKGEMLASPQAGISSFGVDAQGEVYVCNMDGKIFRVEMDTRAVANIAGGN